MENRVHVQEVLYRPGEAVPYTGQYFLLDEAGGRVDSATVSLKAGQIFPNISVGYQLKKDKSPDELFIHQSNLSPDDFSDG